MANKAESKQYEFRHDSGQVLVYDFVRSARKTLGLYVHRNGTVTVRAPLRLPLNQVHIFLSQRWDWLQHQQQRFQSQPSPILIEYRHGSTFQHLGQTYSLQIIPASRTSVSLVQDRVVIALPEKKYTHTAAIKKVLEAWQRETATALFAERLQHCYQMMQALNLPYPTLRLRKMRSRWGSCSRHGDITLNLELIRMPIACIDYVITHELCHLRVFNHSAAFYALQSQVMPDWKERKQQLTALARELSY